ncbi:unnamed protein product [Ceratitis capitata]|uniref:(Mediterranean fruit fly) hypothetical protein n=1 Tax=Ceratitis capitata TaxID=7213 RepID=A0A811U7Z4_CERCA|nr:unnamed protein product [Ceratitis capitata]
MLPSAIVSVKSELGDFHSFWALESFWSNNKALLLINLNIVQSNKCAVGGDGGDDGDDKEKAEEEERERQEAIREAEERRKEKHRKMEEEREKMRQDIRDKVSLKIKEYGCASATDHIMSNRSQETNCNQYYCYYINWGIMWNTSVKIVKKELLQEMPPQLDLRA